MDTASFYYAAGGWGLNHPPPHILVSLHCAIDRYRRRYYNEITKIWRLAMKKIICILLTIYLTLSLCACSEATAGISEAWENGLNGTAVVPGTKEDSDAVQIPLSAIRLHVSFGPEFEVVMTDYLRILMVNPANAEAEALLAGLQLKDRCYCFAFDEVLAAAQEQGYLKAGITMEMNADSQDTSVWTNASKELLMRPVDAFRKETGALFGCYLVLPDTAPEQFDYSQHTKAERTTEEYHKVFYPTGAVSGYTQWRSVTDYPDGRTDEWYAFEIKGGSVTISSYPDGTCFYSQTKDHSISKAGEIWEGPDGCGYRERTGKANLDTGEYIFESHSGFENGYYFEDTYNADGNFASRTRDYPDGSHEVETFYENGNLHTREYKGANGVYESVSFFENGNQESLKLETAEGYYEEQKTEDGKFVYLKLADAGMTNVREAFYTDGKPTKVIIDGVVHEDWATLSMFG